MAERSINLIPQQEVQEQERTKLLSLSTIFAIAILVSALGVTIFLTVKTYQIKDSIKKTDANIENLRSQIRSLSSVEITARTVDKKFKVLDVMFKTGSNFSLLMEEINARRPENVFMTDFNIRQSGEILLSGSGKDFLAVSAFMSSLVDKNFSKGNNLLKELFKSVTLSSVNLEKRTGLINFTIAITYEPKLLVK
jgi:Tfp pilus assembly protein PilN